MYSVARWIDEKIQNFTLLVQPHSMMQRYTESYVVKIPHYSSVSFAVRIYIILYFVDSKRYSKVFLTYLL